MSPPTLTFELRRLVDPRDTIVIERPAYQVSTVVMATQAPVYAWEESPQRADC